MSSGPPTNLPPAFRLNQMIMSLWVPQVVHAAAELGVADVLADGPLPSSAVAARLGTHPDATERLLRALVTLELLAPRGERFELTEVGRLLETSSPSSRRAWSRLMGGPGVWKAWGCLTECVRTGRMAWGAGGVEASSGTEHFDEMARDPAAAAIFHQAMVELTRGVAPGIVGAVDLRGARRVADVGGGYGALLCAILEAHPGMEGVVFDLEHARGGALQLFASALEWVLSFSDINMLVNTGGRERTEAEYRALLEAAGLRVTCVRETPSFYRIFEAART